MSGGIKNIVISNCVFQNTDRGIRIKTRRERGGYIDGILVGNIIMDKDKTPEISNISINGIIARNVEASGIYMYGLPERNISCINTTSFYIIQYKTLVFI